MRITPLDVRKQEFRRSVRGFDCDEVRAFLNTTADEYEAVLVDNKQLRERIITQEEKIAEYRNMEKALRDTLMTAERVMQETRNNATREGELIVRDAGVTAQRVLDEARTRTEEMRREILSLYNEKESYLARFRGLAEAQISFIDSHNRDFEDLDRQLMRKAEAFVETAVAAAARSTDVAPSVESVAETVAEAVVGADAAPVGASGHQDDVWRHYTPGNAYAASPPRYHSDHHSDHHCDHRSDHDSGQDGIKPRTAAAVDTEAMQAQITSLPPSLAARPDDDDQPNEVASEQEPKQGATADGP